MIGEVLADALRFRGPLPALFCHIGAGTAGDTERIPFERGDRTIDLDRGLDEDLNQGMDLDLEGDQDLGGDQDPGPVRGPAPEGPVGLVALVAATATDLRKAVPLLGGLPETAHVVVALKSLPPQRDPAVPVVPGTGQWSGLFDLRVRRHGKDAWTCELCFEDPVEVRGVVGALAQGVVGGRRGAALVPLATVRGRDAGLWRPGDTQVVDAHRADAVPGEGPARSGPSDDVRGRDIGRWSVATSSWAAAGRPGGVVPSRLCVDDVPPIDERVVNPTGFTRRSKTTVGRLITRGGRWELIAGRSVRWRVPEDGTVTDADVAGLRDLRAVRVEWGRHSGPLSAVRAVAGLASAGVPLVGDTGPGWASCLGGELRSLLTSVRVDDLADELVREEHSIRLRRAALRTHGVRARWRALGTASGTGVPAAPVVSVVLCTRRPEMVGFALRQVARQRGVDVELVLGLHGFGADAPGVGEAVADFRAAGGDLLVFQPDPDAVLGSVLNEAIARVSGTLVAKMDDDDWYGPDHLADLVLAREYSGADLVGSPAEFVYLEELDLTVRTQKWTEALSSQTAGGSLLMDRVTVEEVGGFRPLPTGEDSALHAGVRLNGGRIYRTHGCNYVLRRKAGGHTWNVGADYFLRPSHRQRAGWHPSALLEADPRDVPGADPLAPAVPLGSVRSDRGHGTPDTVEGSPR